MSFDDPFQLEEPAWVKYCTPFFLSSYNDETGTKLEKIHQLIDDLEYSCKKIIHATMWPSLHGVPTDELLSKQKLLGAAIERRESIVEEERCRRVVHAHELEFPPETEECDICCEITPSTDVVSFPCCGKSACETCTSSGHIESCPFCRGLVSEEDGTAKIEALARNGAPRAQRSMGVRCATGRHGVPRDIAKAKEWFELALDQGLGAAAYDLGNLYMTSYGDTDTAKKYFERGAHAGNAYAQFNLAMMVSSEKEAVKYLTLAAVGGLGNAQVELGKKFVDGAGWTPASGLPKSLERGKYWFEQAIRDNDNDGPHTDEARENFALVVVQLAQEMYCLRHNLCTDDSWRYRDVPGHSPYPMAAALLSRSVSARSRSMLSLVESEISDHCANCQRTKVESKLLRCRRCRGAYYCGKECQTAHWHAGHKKDCKAACKL